MNGLSSLQKLKRDQRGLSTVEYMVLLVLILAGSIGTWNQIGGKVKAKLGSANTELGKVSVKQQD